MHGSNTLDCGFLEKADENAPAHEEMRKTGLSVKQQRGMAVADDGPTVGEQFGDLVQDLLVGEIYIARSA